MYCPPHTRFFRPHMNACMVLRAHKHITIYPSFHHSIYPGFRSSAVHASRSLMDSRTHAQQHKLNPQAEARRCRRRHHVTV